MLDKLVRTAMFETMESMILMSASMIEGTEAGEWINGDDANNAIFPGGGDDEIYAPLGSNAIDGGAGNDLLLVYGGLREDYSVRPQSDGSFVLIGAGLNGLPTVNSLRSVEGIVFDNGLRTLDTELSDALANGPRTSDLVEVPSALMFEAFLEEMLVAEEPILPEEPSAPEERFAAAPPVPEDVFVPEEVSVLEQVFAAETAFVPQNDTPPVASGDFLGRVVELTNEVRRQNGLQDLTVNSQLQQAAQVHSENMASQDFFGHNGLDGTLPWDRGLAADYDYRFYGENIAAGQQTPEEVVQGWVNSPSHLANILNPADTEIGVGYLFLANDRGDVNFNHYWAQEFGTRR